MKAHISSRIESILIANKEILSQSWDQEYSQVEKTALFRKNYQDHIHDLDIIDQHRILNELEKLGPIQAYIDEPDVTEILVNQPNQVIFEKSEVVKDDGSPYVVYTPYSKKWKENFKKTKLRLLTFRRRRARR